MKYKIILSLSLSLFIAACSELPKNHPAETIGRFQLHDEVVTDSATGLMWTRCLIGATWDGQTCSGKATAYSWQQAQAAVKTLNYAGHGGWRIPSLAELKTLVESESDQGLVKVPHVDHTVFPTPHCKGARRGAGDHDGHSCWQWTTTPVDKYPQHGWLVYFDYAYNTGIYAADSFALRLVRNKR